jgi:hypothetical protein
VAPITDRELPLWRSVFVLSKFGLGVTFVALSLLDDTA